ncbi:DNA-binding protein [Escherichia coli]
MTIEPMGTPDKALKNTGPWTQQEDDLLIDLYPTHTSKEIAAKVNRTVSSVENHIFKLRKARKVLLKHARLGRAQIDLIIKCRHTRTVQEVAQELGCSINSVKVAAFNQGVSFRKCGETHHKAKYPDTLANLVRELRDGHGWTWKQIAGHISQHNQLSLSVSTVATLYRRSTADDAVRRELLRTE